MQPLSSAFLTTLSPDGEIIEKKYGSSLYVGSGHKRISADEKEQRILELEKENRELKHSNEILQEALGFFAVSRKK